MPHSSEQLVDFSQFFGINTEELRGSTGRRGPKGGKGDPGERGGKGDKGAKGWKISQSNRGEVITTSDKAELTTLTSSTTSAKVIDENEARIAIILYNDSTQTLYLKFGINASSTDYTYKVAADSLLELINPVYTGRIDGVWASANGTLYITELL